MKKDLTELVFVLDRSGSMGGLEDDTIGGFNSMLKKQQEQDGECIVTTVLFDNNITLLHDRIDIKAVKPITKNEYFVGGCTALLDAVGIAVSREIAVQKNTAEEFQAQKVMFVIITDGMENASREYSFEKVKKMIEQKREEDNWEFVFLGANIDAVGTAGQFGIGANRAVDYVADSDGTDLNFRMMSDVVTEFRAAVSVPEGCLDQIKKYKQKRGKK